MKIKNLFLVLFTLSFVNINCLNYKQAFDIGVHSYIFAYPLVLMEVTKDALVGTESSKGVTDINKFIHALKFPDYNFKGIVRPNVDTLYSTAWLDLSKEPIVVSVPNTNDRYYLIEVLDAWTNVIFSIGKRTTGTLARNFVIAGPNWKKPTKGVKPVIKSPTNLVWLLGRVQTNGTKDYDSVNKIQRGFKLIPLHKYNTGYKPKYKIFNPSYTKMVSPPQQVANMDASIFYKVFVDALKENPPLEEDNEILKKLKLIGIVPGKDFDFHNLSPEIQKALNDSIQEAKKQISDIKHLSKKVNGWDIINDMGTYSTNYLKRARIAYAGLGANLPEDAIYPTAFVDSKGEQLNGNNDYVIHFDQNKLPLVNAFWSLTVYNKDGFLVKNPIDRSGLGSKDNLKFNKDGSLDIYTSWMKLLRMIN